jgi:UDP-N-acetylmuramate dehydrogenase
MPDLDTHPDVLSTSSEKERLAYLQELQRAFGSGALYPLSLQTEVSLARYTSARIGGPADALVEIQSVAELVEIVSLCWRYNIPFMIMGGGSNLLVSDSGVRGLVVVNRARQVRFDPHANPPNVWAQSGANFGLIARQAAAHGLAGLEWAAGIPGTVGGAVVGNAGAHGGDIAGNLLLAEILQLQGVNCTPGVNSRPDRQIWSTEKFAFAYRTSLLKLRPSNAVTGPQSNAVTGFVPRSPHSLVLTATLRLEHSTPAAVQAKIDQFVAHRRLTQPPGASMGSMFKNPPGDYAGRLIEAAGLKGSRIGDAQISPLHANFFINLGSARAAEVYQLIQLARQTVAEKFGVQLELEIELIGL